MKRRKKNMESIKCKKHSWYLLEDRVKCNVCGLVTYDYTVHPIGEEQ